MIYDLSKDIDINKANERFNFLIKNKKTIELKEKRKKRSINQNSYLHVLFALFGLEYGYSLDESKTLIKRELKYFYKKNDHIFLVKTSKMNSKELTIFIEKFRNYSSVNGLYLPTSKEYLTNYTEFDRLIINNEIHL